MKWGALLVLLFGILLIGLSYFFYNNYISVKETEGFQVYPQPYEISSYVFPNSQIQPVYYGMGPAYSTIGGVRNEFINLLNDPMSYSGWQDRFAVPSRENISYVHRSNVAGLNTVFNKVVCKNYVSYTQGNNTLEFCDIVENTTFGRIADQGYSCDGKSKNRFFIAGGYVDVARWDNYSWSDKYKNDISIYSENDGKYINYINSNAIANARKFLFSNATFNLGLNNENINDYTRFTLPGSIQGLPKNQDNEDIKTREWTAPGHPYCSQSQPTHAMGNLAVPLYSPPLMTNLLYVATREFNKLYVYGTLNNTHRLNMMVSYIYGAAFNFRNTELIDVYLNVPYTSSNFNGIGYYSFGYFLQDFPSMPGAGDLYKPNSNNIISNSSLINNLRDYNPPSYYNRFYDYESTIPYLMAHASQVFASKITPVFISRLPRSLQQYTTSWIYNRNITMLNNRLNYAASNPNIVNKHLKQGNINKRMLLLSLAFSNYKDASNKYTTNGLSEDSNAMVNWAAYLSNYGYANVNATSRYIGLSNGFRRDLNSISGHVSGNGYTKPTVGVYSSNTYYNVADSDTAELIACADSNVVVWTYNTATKDLYLRYYASNYMPAAGTYTANPTALDITSREANEGEFSYNPNCISGSIRRNWQIKSYPNLGFTGGTRAFTFSYYNEWGAPTDSNIFNIVRPFLIYGIRGIHYVPQSGGVQARIDLYYEYNTGIRTDPNNRFYFVTTPVEYNYSSLQTLSNTGLNGYDMYNITTNIFTESNCQDIAKLDSLVNSYTIQPNGGTCWFQYAFDSTNEANATLLNTTSATGYKTVFLNRRRVASSPGTSTPPLDSEIASMISDFKYLIPKITATYPDTIDIKKHSFLNEFSQMYYEKSEGTEEPIFIYDTYRVDSNMVDIRFDCQRRLPQAQYRELLIKYKPQVERYNRLFDLYNQDTWQTTYSNITDLQIDLSNALTAIDPVLNPVYPAGDIESLTSLSNANKTYMIALSNAVFGIKSRTDADTAAAAASNAMAAAELATTPAQKAAAEEQRKAASDAAIAKMTALNVDDETIIGTREEQNNWYYSTISANYTLSNQIGGIETKVARAFITVDSNGLGSNIIINGFAIGPNAALSFNTTYNANIEVIIDGSPGNINYQPQLVYKYNVVPKVSCSNIDFMRQGAQAYMDTVWTDLSGFTSNTYSMTNGDVRVDKILGFQQINDSTCGFTWVESQYDQTTNKKFKTTTRNVRIPFLYDESRYADPQLYINSNEFSYTTTSYPFQTLENPDSELTQVLASNISNSNTIKASLQAFLNSNIYAILPAPTYYQYLITPVNLNFNAQRDIIGVNGELYRPNDATLTLYSNINSTYSAAGRVGAPLDPNKYSVSMNAYINTLTRETVSREAPGMTGDNTISDDFNDFASLMSRFMTASSRHGNSISGVGTVTNSLWFSSDSMLSDTYNLIKEQYLESGNTTRRLVRRSPTTNEYILEFSISFNDYNSIVTLINYYKTRYGITIVYPRSQEMNNFITSNTNSQLRITTASLIGTRAAQGKTIGDDFDRFYNILRSPIPLYSGINDINVKYSDIFLSNNSPDSPLYIENAIKYKVISPANLSIYNKYVAYSNFYTKQITGLTQELALNESNVVSKYQALGYYIIPRPKMEYTTLVNADGACPLVTCTDPSLMAQLLDLYNLDSNSPDTILRILKGVTPNMYQCDYLVEIKDKNSNIQQQTKSFYVGIDILDCSYYIASNGGPNTGYFIQEDTPFINDSADTDLSGFQYIGGVFLTYSNTVTNVLNPLITNAYTAASNMYNAFRESRLATYDALGRMKQLEPSSNCILQYPALRNLIINNQQFCRQFFNSYPFLDRYMNTIIRVAIYNSTSIVVVFSEDNLYLSHSGTVQYGGTTTTSSALYSISNTSQDSICKYTATYVSSSPIILPPKEYMRSMSSNTHIIYANGYANILDNLNIRNKYTYIDIHPLSIGILNLIVSHESLQGKNIYRFIRAQKISCNEILYKIEYGIRSSSQNTVTSIEIVYVLFKKSENLPVIDTITTYYRINPTTLIVSSLITPTQIIIDFNNSTDNLSSPIDVPIITTLAAGSIDKLTGYFTGHREGFSQALSDADIFKQALLKNIGVVQTPTDYKYRGINNGRFSVEYVLTNPTADNFVLQIEDTNRIATFYFDTTTSITQNNLYRMNKPRNIYSQVVLNSNLNIRDLTIDNWGYMYITDAMNKKVYYYTNPLDTVAGNSLEGYFINNQERISPENKYGPTVPLYGIWGLTTNLAGHLYIAETGNEIVRYIDTNTYIINTVAGTVPSLSEYNQFIQRYGDTTGPALTTLLEAPTYITVDSKNIVYFIDQWVKPTRCIKVIKKDTSGASVVERFIPINQPSFMPQFIRAGPDDNIYCIETNKISKITPDSNYSIVKTSTGPIYSLVLDSENNLYYINTLGLHVLRVDSNIVYIPTTDMPPNIMNVQINPTTGALSNLLHMAIDPTTNLLYIANSSNMYTIPIQSLLTYIENPVIPNPTIDGIDIKLESIIAATPETTSFIYTPTNEDVSNPELMNYFRNYYNATYSIYNGNANSSILSRVYSAVLDPTNNSITYTVSVYNKDANGNYLTNVIPNDAAYNNTISYNVRFLTQADNIYNLTMTPIPNPAVPNPVVDPAPIEQFGPEYFLPRIKYTNLRFTPISVNPIVDARIISAWPTFASSAPLYELAQLQFYVGTTNIYLYTVPNDYNYLLTKANITVPNPAKIQTYQNYYKLGSLQPNGLYKVIIPSIRFDLKVPANLDGFSFVSGRNTATCIREWLLEGSVDNGLHWLTIHQQKVPFTARSPVYPSAFYQTPIFSFNPLVPLTPLPQIPAYRGGVSGFTDYNSSLITAAYFSVSKPYNYRVYALQFFDIQKRSISFTERKVEDKYICTFEEPTSIFGYSFITNSVSSDLDPQSWKVFGSTDGSKWKLYDKQENYTTPKERLYQLPIFSIEDKSKYNLPQPKSTIKKEGTKKETIVDYYKQKINPHVVPNFKKIMYDNDTDIYYVLFDEYNLDKELIAIDQIIGVSIKNAKVKAAYLYADEYGTQKPYNLSLREMKRAWDRNVGLPLDFKDF